MVKYVQFAHGPSFVVDATFPATKKYYSANLLLRRAAHQVR